MLCYVKKGKREWNAKNIVHCVEKVLWLIERVKNGVERFRVGDFLLDDAPWLGRPVEVDMIKSRL